MSALAPFFLVAPTIEEIRAKGGTLTVSIYTDVEEARRATVRAAVATGKTRILMTASQYADSAISETMQAAQVEQIAGSETITNPTMILTIVRHTSEFWDTYNHPLLLSEIGVDTTTGEMKLGDGISLWPDLPTLDTGGFGERIDAETARAMAAEMDLQNSKADVSWVEDTFATKSALNSAVSTLGGDISEAQADISQLGQVKADVSWAEATFATQAAFGSNVAAIIHTKGLDALVAHVNAGHVWAGPTTEAAGDTKDGLVELTPEEAVLIQNRCVHFGTALAGQLILALDGK